LQTKYCKLVQVVKQRMNKMLIDQSSSSR